MHAYMDTCILTYLHTCILASLHPCILAYLHTCILAYLHTCILAYLHTCILAYFLSVTKRRCCSSLFLTLCNNLQINYSDKKRVYINNNNKHCISKPSRVLQALQGRQYSIVVENWVVPQRKNNWKMKNVDRPYLLG